MSRRQDAVLGCILGGAIGDAAGSAFEGGASQDGTWRITDDTQLTLATCEALVSGEVDPAAVAGRMLDWFRRKRVTGIGSSTLKALRDLNAGAHWALAGCKGERAAGNGAAMRIAPLAFCVDPATAHGRQLVRDVSRITHHHEEAYVGALAVALAVRGASVSGVVPSLPELASWLPDSVVRDRLNASSGAVSIAEAATRFGSSGYVAESVPLALAASCQVMRIGFEAMLEQLIAAGGDTDTNASIAGQIAGTSLGLSRLPMHLVERLPDQEMVWRIARALAEALAPE